MLGFSTFSPRARNTLLALLAAGFVLNCFPVALLPSLDFLFGSIAVLVVVSLFGAAWGTLAGALAGLYTLHLWNHPHGLILLATEALFIGLMRRKSRNMLLLDGIYWLLIGMPLVWIFYSLALQAASSTVHLMMVKFTVNGIFNALVASLLVMYSPLQREVLSAENTDAPHLRSFIDTPSVAERRPLKQMSLKQIPAGQMSLSQAIFNLSVGCALLPALLLTIMSVRQERNAIESGLQWKLKEQSTATARGLGVWRDRRLNTAREVSALAAQAELQASPTLRHDATLLLKPLDDVLSARLVAWSKTASPSATSSGIASQNLIFLRSPARQQATRIQAPNALLSRHLQTVQSPFFAFEATASDAAASDADISDTIARTANAKKSKASSTAATFTQRNPASRSANAARLDVLYTPILYAPIRRGGRVRGFLAIRFDPSRLRRLLDRNLSNAAVTGTSPAFGTRSHAALIDAKNRVVTGSFAGDSTDSTMPDARTVDAAAPQRASSGAASTVAGAGKVVSAGDWAIGNARADGVFRPGKRGRIIRFADGSYQWSPKMENMAAVEQARHSVFVRETRLNGLPWKLVVSLALEPQLRSLRSSSFSNLLLMLLLSFASLVLAQVLSLSLTRPLSRLALVTTDLPLKLIGPQKPDVAWPDTPLEELDALVRNFKSMSSTLQENFRQIQSARRRLEEEQAHLQEANRLKDEFLAVLSHELRTPLVPIIGYADLIVRGALQGDETTEAAHAIERNARAQLRLIEDLLDVSRIISGKMRLEIGPLHLETLVHDALDTVHRAAQDKDIHLALRVQENLPIFHGDSARLKQILWNLLSNAVKFTPPGGRIEVSLDHAAGLARLSVVDSGQGISAEFLPFVFDRFRQAAEHLTRSHGGLGLGLAIVRHMVEAHGGHIEARSQGEGHGTAFLVTLPFQTPANAAAISDDAANANAAANATSPAPLAALHMSTHAAPDRERNSQNNAQTQGTGAPNGEKESIHAQADFSQADLARRSLSTPPVNEEARDEHAFDEHAFDEPRIHAGASDDVSNGLSNDVSTRGENDASVNAAAQRAALELDARLSAARQEEAGRQEETARPVGATATGSDKNEMHLGVGRLRGARVLVVDDEADNRGLLGAIIRLEGGEVTDAASGGEGLLLAQRATPSVIVSDIGMPVMDGYEFLQKLRAVESLKDVPVVAFTAHADGRDRVRSLQNGFNAYLSKPAQADDVIDVIESLCERHGD